MRKSSIALGFILSLFPGFVCALAPRRPSAPPAVVATTLDIAVTNAYASFTGYKWLKSYPYLFRLYRETTYDGTFLEWLADNGYDSPIIADCEYTITLAASNKNANSVCLDFSSVEGSPVQSVCVPFKWDQFTDDYTFKNCPCLSTTHVNALPIYTEVRKTATHHAGEELP
jgi:hypothetical protein